MALWTQTRKSPGGVSDIAELKAHFDALFQRFGAPPSDIRFESGQLGPIPGEWAHPPRAVPGRILLYFHGGGFVAGSPESHRTLAGRLAEAGEADAFAVR